jgi:hypothetical protein
MLVKYSLPVVWVEVHLGRTLLRSVEFDMQQQVTPTHRMFDGPSRHIWW